MRDRNGRKNGGNHCMEAFAQKLVRALQDGRFRGVKPLRLCNNGPKNGARVKIDIIIPMPEADDKYSPEQDVRDAKSYPPLIFDLVVRIANKSHITLKEVEVNFKSEASSETSGLHLFKAEGFSPQDIEPSATSTPKDEPLRYADMNPKQRREFVQQILSEPMSPGGGHG